MESNRARAERDLNNNLIQPSRFIDKVTEDQKKNGRLDYCL